MAYRPPPDNCRYDHNGYDCTPLKEAFKGSWRGHQYNQEPLMAPMYAPAPNLHHTRLTRGHPSPAFVDLQHNYEYGVNRNKRQRISPSETTIRDSNPDSISSIESCEDQNDQAKRLIDLLLRAARVSPGTTVPLSSSL